MSLKRKEGSRGGLKRATEFNNKIGLEPTCLSSDGL